MGYREAYWGDEIFSIWMVMVFTLTSILKTNTFYSCKLSLNLIFKSLEIRTLDKFILSLKEGFS